jgi:hypothetical protein
MKTIFLTLFALIICGTTFAAEAEKKDAPKEETTKEAQEEVKALTVDDLMKELEDYRKFIQKNRAGAIDSYRYKLEEKLTGKPVMIELPAKENVNIVKARNEYSVTFEKSKRVQKKSKKKNEVNLSISVGYTDLTEEEANNIDKVTGYIKSVTLNGSSDHASIYLSIIIQKGWKPKAVEEAEKAAAEKDKEKDGGEGKEKP